MEWEGGLLLGLPLIQRPVLLPLPLAESSSASMWFQPAVSVGVFSAGVFLSMSNCLCVCPLDSQGGFYRHRNGHGGWLARVVLKNATVGCENRSASPHISPRAQARGWSLRQGPCFSLPSTSLPTSCVITIHRYKYNAIYLYVYNIIYTIMCIYNLSVDIII